MTDDQIPNTWRRINDVCIGTGGGLDASGRDRPEYTVFHHGDRGAWTWEACRAGELLALGLPTMDEAIKVCRDDFKARRGGG